MNELVRDICMSQVSCDACLLMFFPDVHTEAVQAALAKHKERKMAVPMPSKRRSLVVQTSMDAYTPPGKEDNLAGTKDKNDANF